MQKQVKQFIGQHSLSLDPQTRFIDRSSQLGEPDQYRRRRAQTGTVGSIRAGGPGQ